MENEKPAVLEHNYMIKLLRLRAEGKLTPGLWHTEVRHDSWCNIHCGGRCNCDPDIESKPA